MLRTPLAIAGLLFAASVASATDTGLGPGVDQVIDLGFQPIPVSVMVPYLQVRDMKGKRVGTIHRGRRFVANKIEGRLYRIDWRGQRVWIQGASREGERPRTAAKPGTYMAVINEAEVPVLAKPNTKKKLGVVKVGQIYAMRTVWNTWAAIQFDDRFGWVPLKSIHVMEQGYLYTRGTRASDLLRPNPGRRSGGGGGGSSLDGYPEVEGPVDFGPNGELTVPQLMAIMPRLSRTEAQRYIDPLNAAMREARITTPIRMAAFLAQIAHESVQLRHWTELGQRSYFDKYEPGTRIGRNLGNTVSGDGYRYRGRGPIQLTGRDNYSRAGRALGLDLVGNPDQVAQPAAGFRTSTWFWSQASLNRYADVADFETLTRRINGGTNGLQDRIAFYQRAKRVLGVV